MNKLHLGSVKAARVHIAAAMNICKGLIKMPDVAGQERVYLHIVVGQLADASGNLETIE